MGSCAIHPRAISQEMLKISIPDVRLKIINEWLQVRLPGVNELKKYVHMSDVDGTNNHKTVQMFTKVWLVWLLWKNIASRMKTSKHKSYWPAHRAGLLWLNFFGQSESVSKFPPFWCVKLWVGWVGRGYIEISRYFPALWINRVTLVTKIKLWYSLGY